MSKGVAFIVGLTVCAVVGWLFLIGVTMVLNYVVTGFGGHPVQVGHTAAILALTYLIKMIFKDSQ